MGAESIVIFGDSGVGKTALTVKWAVSHFVEDYEPTIVEDSYKKELLLDSKETLSLDVLDTGGDPQYSNFRPGWIRGGRAFIIVFSAASRESFASVPLFAKLIRQHHRAAYPLALVATKSDLPIRVSVKEGQACAVHLQAKYFHLSAKSGTAVGQPFEYLARRLAQQESPTSRPLVANPKSGQTFATRNRAWAWARAARPQWIFAWTKSTFGSCIGAR